MRLKHIEYRLYQQLSLLNFISNSVDNLTRVGLTNITPQRIEARLSALKEHWEKFSLNHDAIGIAMLQLDSHDKQLLADHSYFINDIYSQCQESYLEAVEKMNSFIEQNQTPIRRVNSNQSVSETSNPITIFHNARLPRIDLPKFNGTSSEWLPFRDLFSSLILSNAALTSVEKLQYLKTSLVGTASHLLKNTPLTADNFQKAWDSLNNFYENKRLLVNSALHSLLSIKRMTKESASELEQLYTTIMQIYRTLETLQRPVHTWDDFIVFIAVQRLDAESTKAWEHHLGSSKEPPTWKQFSEFLMTRMLSLQAFERSRTVKSSPLPHQHYARTHYSGKTNDSSSNNTPNNCSLCSDNHFIIRCPQYLSKSIQQRQEIISKNKLCYNCLGNHRSSNCTTSRRCNKCGKKHHTSIHQPQAKSAQPTASNAGPNSKEAEKRVHLSKTLKTSPPGVFLPTAQVIVVTEQGEKAHARAFLDQGSEISLISERLAQTLHMPRRNSSVPLVGIGAHRSGRTKGIVSCKLKPHFDSEFECQFEAHVLPKLTSDIPAEKVNPSCWTHLANLQLADPSFNSPRLIDIIIGSDIYGQIIETGIVKQGSNEPIAQRTKFGWVISGPSGSSSISQAHGYHISIDKELHDLLQQFWHLEEAPSSNTSSLSLDDRECENHFQTTHTRDETGRYTVQLPLKDSPNKLGDSKTKALHMMSRLSTQFSTNPTYHQNYSAFLKEYESLHHMRQIPHDAKSQHVYYLPHHGVIREGSSTTKLRVVFNGSSRTTSGLSLNDILHTGAKLQIDLLDVLIWFRQFRYVFSSDIEKMYRQIKIHPSDLDLQRILWIDPSQNLLTYQLATVTYGLACAPFLALRTLHQLVIDEGHKFPLAIPSLQKGRYVDDIFGGADSVQEAQDIAHQVNQLCMAGGFPLRKWISNQPLVLQPIPENYQLQSSSLPIKRDAIIHALGMCWKPTSDTFHFAMKERILKITTKRSILSTIAQLFDPLGLLSPVIIRAKIFIQELWSIKLNWDDPLPIQLTEKWANFVQQLQELSSISFPRWLGTKTTYITEIHGFCDASQLAIAAAVYIRVTTPEGNINTTLVCSKTKVAPLKRITIPRLELSGAVLLTKLVAHVIKVLNLDKIPIHLWTDSAIVYTWINNHPSRWKQFVHNRVCIIQERLPQANWHFVPGKDNPADCATRGLTVTQLSEHTSWWIGPQWLKHPPSQWPTIPQSVATRDNLEERPTQALVVIPETTQQLWDLIYRYSSWTRLIRITAVCQRFIARLRKTPNSTLANPLTPGDLEQAKEHWIKTVQHSYFQKEMSMLSDGQTLPKFNPLNRLTPYLDTSGFLRVGGRLQSSMLPNDAKHPLILPRDSPLTKLLIDDAHQRTLHGGTQATLSFLRTNYWIIGGRAPVRSFILKCVRCSRYRQKRAQQLMGQLPAERTNQSRPFLHSGLDYAGPFILKTWKGRAARTYKAYIALFICQSTSAVHLELVTDYTTEAFIAAYKRFTARRGLCATLMSDCGTNFKGADRELQKLFSSSSKELKHLASLLANDGTTWKFNPPGAPHMGGRWEAGVKSVKYHLRRVIGDQSLTYKEMTTLLTQIEAVLNSRPLCPLTDDPDDLAALTPGHFLIGSALTIIPEPSLEEEKTSRLSKWQKIRQMLDSFWTRWSKEYLQRYHSTYKWNQPAPSIKVGTLVLIIDERYPPSKWPLGRITQTHPGPDGHTRVVTVRTQSSTFKRPVAKLCPLPIDPDLT